MSNILRNIYKRSDVEKFQSEPRSGLKSVAQADEGLFLKAAKRQQMVAQGVRTCE